MTIGSKIKTRREALGMSQVEVAETIGITQSMLCQIERGTKVPSLPLSVEIANVLNCSITEFIS